MYVYVHTCAKSYLEGKAAGEEVATDDVKEEIDSNFLYFPSTMYHSYEIHFSSAQLPSLRP